MSDGTTKTDAPEEPGVPEVKAETANPDTSNENTQKDKMNGNNEAEEDASAAPAKPKPSIAQRLGLDAPTIILMLKGAVAPTIGIAMMQSPTVATYFANLGYLVAIITVLSLSILPRGKYIQMLILNVLFICLGAAVACLILWSSLQARLQTQVSATARYNSSQSAVSALWLFVNIWLVNTLRAKYPALNIAAIFYSIITNIGCTYSPLMTSVAGVEAFIKQLVTAMLTGVALSTGVSLLIFPISSRTVYFGQMKGALMLMRGALKQEKLYLQSLEREDMFNVPSDVSGHAGDENSKAKSGQKADPNTVAEANELKTTILKMRELYGKIQADLPFAKRDIAWSKLGATDLKDIFNHVRHIFIPVVGISTVIDIFQRLAERRGWVYDADESAEQKAEKDKEKRVWNNVMKQLHEPFEILSDAIDQGIEHAGILLEILPRPKAAKKSTKKSKKGAATDGADADVEAKGDLVSPGDDKFAETLKQKVQNFHKVRQDILQTWAKEKGLMTEQQSLSDIEKPIFTSDPEERWKDQSQLYTLVYLETLMQAAGEAVLAFVAFADKKVEDGTMSKNRLIVPNSRRVRKWFESVFQDQSDAKENNNDVFDTGLAIAYMGDGFAEKKKDPEHLPPTNLSQRIGNVIRTIPRFLGSEQSTYGFRVACATMTIGIVGFLQQTQTFFFQQRLVWSMIIIAIGMSETSGQSIFGFFMRVAGSAVAMITSWIMWYIVDQHPPGIIVFLYVFIAIEYYFFLKFPRFVPGIMILIVTQVMIVGYELQVGVLGEAASAATGQPVYPIYILAPYRLATVAGGSLIAFIWTMFPVPLTDRRWLRKDLSATLYLLAKYFGVISKAIGARLNGTGGDPDVKGTPAYHLNKVRTDIFGKLIFILPSLQQHAEFQRWEPDIGGKFPRDVYQDIIKRSMRLTSYMSLMAYAVAFSERDVDEDNTWLETLSELMQNIKPTSNNIICTLTMLSNSLHSGHSLPPFLPLPRPLELTRQLEALAATESRERAHELLDARNMSRSGYAEFAVLQVCGTLICHDVEGLEEDIASLVGVVDFTFKMADSSSTLDDSTGTNGDKGKGKQD